MKKIIVFALICLPFFSFSQTNEQVAAMIVEVLSQENWSEHFAEQVNEFGDVIIQRPMYRAVSERVNEQFSRNLLSEDLLDSPFQVLILDIEEVKNRGFNQRRLMTWGFSFQENNALIFISFLHEDTKKVVRGEFLFQPDGAEWVLVNQQMREGF